MFMSHYATEVCKCPGKELRKERLRADAYDTMIDIAEDMFKVPIRKKAGAKR